MPTPRQPDFSETIRRDYLKKLPALTRFYFGAITPLNIDQFTLRELREYVQQMEEVTQAGG